MYCHRCGSRIGGQKKYCDNCHSITADTKHSKRHGRIEFQIHPLADRQTGRIVSIPVRMFLGALGFLFAVLIAVLCYAFYRSGMFPF